MPTKKLLDNASMFGIFSAWWTGCNFDADLTCKNTRLEFSNMISAFQFKFGYNDIWGDEFKRWFDIKQTFNIGKQFVNRTYMPSLTGNTVTNNNNTEVHNSLNYKQTVTAKNDI